jgi:predicted Zn-dependent peptidase
VSQEELARAKNLLKASILSNSENRMILLENIVQRVLMNQEFLSEYQLCDLVDKVSVEDINRY